jgi:hypothetical protein
MKNLQIIICTLLLMLSTLHGCAQPVRTTSRSSIVREIPLDKKGNPLSGYKYKREMEKILKLDYLEDGFDSLEIRFWYMYGFSRNGELIILKNRSNN